MNPHNYINQKHTMNIKQLHRLKEQQEKIACLTVYDASFAKLAINAGVEVLLVGDSLGMTVKGYPSTLSVSINDILHHLKAVNNIQQNKFIIADMPFMSYSNLSQTLDNATRLMQNGANMVKLEGENHVIDYTYNLSSHGIPVCGHLGLQPQLINKISHYTLQATTDIEADNLINAAVSLQEAGAEMLILEMIPAKLAAKVTKKLTIPVIGIGAGVDTDGQILVSYDMLGITSTKLPSFVRNFTLTTNSIPQAIEIYVQSVKNKSFPSPEYIPG